MPENWPGDAFPGGVTAAACAQANKASLSCRSFTIPTGTARVLHCSFEPKNLLVPTEAGSNGVSTNFLTWAFGADLRL